MVKHKRINVSMRALIQRINRKIRADDLQLKTARNHQMELDVGGRFYVVNTRINGVMQWSKGLDLEEYARELGVLRPYETLTPSLC
jgi:hypothetical protein